MIQITIDIAEFVSDYMELEAVDGVRATNYEIAEALLDANPTTPADLTGKAFEAEVKELEPQLAYYTGRDS